MHMKQSIVVLCIGLAYSSLCAVEQKPPQTIPVAALTPQQSVVSQLPRIASLLVSAVCLAWQWWHKPSAAQPASPSLMPAQSDQISTSTSTDKIDAPASTSYARQLHAYKRALRKRLTSEVGQLRSLIASHEPFDRVRLAMPADLYAVRFDAVRTHLIDIGPIEKQIYITRAAVGTLVERYAIPLTCYDCCIGAPLQQKIHAECIALIEQCAACQPDVMQETIVRFADTARVYNQAGFCGRALEFCNLCWALLSSVALIGLKTAVAVGAGVALGIAKEMGDATQLISNPQAWLDRLLLLLEIAVICIARIMQQEPLVCPVAKETVMAQGELIAWHTLIATIEKQIVQAAQTYSSNQPVPELTLVPEAAVKRQSLGCVAQLMHASAEHMYEHTAYAYLEPETTSRVLVETIACPTCLLGIVAIEAINRSCQR